MGFFIINHPAIKGSPIVGKPHMSHMLKLGSPAGPKRHRSMWKELAKFLDGEHTFAGGETPIVVVVR
jgi:hypothetical protein